MPKGKRKTTAGRLSVPVDVRKPSDIPAFERMLGLGPITLVLVYADWCGHCQRFKKDMWNEVSAMPKKTVNTAAVHYDMLDKTSVANANIEGYPSLLLVGKDKKPAEFTSPEGTVTNAMPTPQSKEQLTQIVNTPVPEELIEENLSPAGNTEAANVTIAKTNAANAMNAATMPISGSLTTVATPPNTRGDIVSNSNTNNKSVQPGLRGGNLYGSLLQVTQDATPAALLLASALYSKKTRRNKRGKKRSAKTRSRK